MQLDAVLHLRIHLEQVIGIDEWKSDTRSSHDFSKGFDYRSSRPVLIPDTPTVGYTIEQRAAEAVDVDIPLVNKWDLARQSVLVRTSDTTYQPRTSGRRSSMASRSADNRSYGTRPRRRLADLYHVRRVDSSLDRDVST